MTALVATMVVVETVVSPDAVEAAPLCATPPLTGSTTISGVVNTYYPGTTATLSAGQASTTVAVGAGVGAGTPLAIGDMVLIVQMQGAEINATNTGAYGDGGAGDPATGYLSNANFVAGLYEYATVTSVAGSSIGLAGSGTNGGLNNTYRNANATAALGQFRYQVIRVPQYSGAAFSAGTPPTAPAWNGTTGGIVALDVAAALNLNGATLNVSGLGFKGGAQRIRAGASGMANTDYRTLTSQAANGQKAEGIAGRPVWVTGNADTVGDGYPNGDFARGAPGNAGGGGTDGNPSANDQNSGGGGGGNGGAGGMGGNTWSSNLPRGGHGGAVVPGSVSRMFLGGGGGAGSDNNGVLTSAGGAGGGAVLIRAGSLTGSGTVNANGAAGGISGQDGSGGGGAGGSVLVLTSATGAASGLAGLTVNARGGVGGDETNASPHGPGGGGGGGQVITSAAASAINVTGGANGVHAGVPYGSTPGSAGTSSTSGSIAATPGTNTGSQCIDAMVTKSVSPASVVPGQSVTFTVTVTNRGPYPSTGTAPISVVDSLPAAVTGASWTCSASAGSSCGAASGSGSLATTANLAVNGTATYTITGTVDPAFTGTLSNTATVAGPSGVPELVPADNTATAMAPATPRADLSVTKTDGATTATPGTNVVYTVVASNAGPSAVVAAPITDALPVGATSGSWTCAAGAGATCGAAGGTMPLSSTVSLAPGASATYTVTVAVSPSATGSLVNTANIATPAGVTETNSANNSATDSDTLTPRADLSITKTDGLTAVDAGSGLTYTIVATNNGPSTVTGANVSDTFPASLTGVTWTCAATGAGSSCPSSGAGAINASVTLAAGGAATFTVSATVVATATGTLSNTATVAAPGGVTDPTPANNTATDTTTITRRADLAITKTDASATAVPGGTVTYTIVVSNAGPSVAVGATVADTLPAALSSANWTCTASAGSVCPASGAGNINTTVDLLPSGTATFVLTANVSASATGTLANTATVTAPGGTTDPNLANNTATDTDTLTPRADLAVTKTDGLTSEVPGTSVSYTIVVSNAGPSAVTGATVSDVVPGTVSGVSWTCVGAGGGSCPASGSGNISTSAVNLPVGATATFTLNGTLSASATGTLANTATVTVPAGVTEVNGANNSATDTDTLTPTGDLAITKTDGQTSAIPGQPVTYTITASNSGPSVMNAAAVADTLPGTLSGVTWTCTGASGGTCGTASGTGNINATVNLPVGGTATFSVTGTIAAGATGSLSNTATITPASGTADPNGANNSATDVDTLTPRADLVVTKTDGQASAVPGAAVTYTIVASNTGPSAVVGAAVSDVVPGTLSSVSWTCVGAGGGSCPASGAGNISTSAVNLPVGATATFTLTGTLSATATGSLVNSVTVSVPAGVTEVNAANNSASDTDTLTPTADLSITKTDGQAAEVPGTPVTYTIVATNGGPSFVTGATVTDTLPAALSGATWTCVAAGTGSTCPASGSGNISATVNLAPAGTATFTLTANVAASATGTLANTATVTPPGGTTDPTPGNNTATDTDTLTPQADLGITKTDGQTTAVPGTSVTYTVVVSNAGPSAVTGASVSDVVPGTLSSVSWTCVGAGGGSCPASGSGNISTSAVNLPVGATATFTLSGTVSATATGLLVNTATVAPPSGVSDSNGTNNSATDSDTLTPTGDLSITKTDGVATEVPGTTVTYTIVASNTGPSFVTGATVTDTLPVVLGGATWTCVAAGTGSSCPAGGSGNISATVNLAAGGTATFTLTAMISASASGTLANTASVAPPGGFTDPTPGNNSATDTDTLMREADLSITKNDGQTTAVPGTSVTYTIVASNVGPSDVLGATVSDTFPAALTGVTWTCTPAGGGSCGTSSGSGDIAVLVDLPVGATATFVVDATVGGTARGSLVNTATVSPPSGVTDPAGGNNSATDVDTLTPRVDLGITKTDGQAAAVPGTSVTYTIVASNAGPSAVIDAPVSDTLPAELTGATWTCVASAGGNCDMSSGSGNIATTVDLAVGATATFQITATLNPAAVGSLSNSVQISAPAGTVELDSSDNVATDIDTVTPQADLSVTKTDGQTAAIPGTSTTYTIVVTNPGPSAVTGAVVDNPPVTLTGVTWTCSATAGSSCSAASGTGSINIPIDLLVGGSATFSLTATIDPGATGTLSNTADVSLPVGVTDPTPANNTATDTNTLSEEADLTISKSDGTSTAVPGGTTVYTVVVGNDGPSDVTGATVSDPLPPGITGVSWTCSASAGATCSASGTGAISDTVDLAVGATATYLVTATISPSATGTITNTATVDPPVTVSDPDPADNAATDADTLTPRADLSVTKDDGTTTLVPGTTTTYTMVVSNGGPSDAPGTVVTDAEPAGVTFTAWSCTPSAGSACTATSGSGSIATTVDLDAGGTATFSVTAAIDPAATGVVDNTVTVATGPGVTDPTPGNDNATDSDTLTPTADLSITKDDGATTATPGGGLTYTITVANAGPSAVSDAAVADVFPATFTGASWTCTAGAGANCDDPNGTGDIATTVDLDPGSSATFTVTGTVDPAATGSLANAATITAPGGVTDPVPGNDSATDADTLTPTADLAITKTDGLTSAQPLDPVTYTIVVTNAGPSAAPNAVVSDTMPAALVTPTWTCTDGTGGNCDTASGSGDIAATVDLLPGGTVTFTVDATIAGSATGTLTNVADVAAPAGVTDPNSADNSATDTTTITTTAALSISKTDGLTSVSAGGSVTYSIVVTNAGPSAVVNATIDDTMPAQLLGVTWTCAAAAGSNCDSAGGSGDISATVDLASGGSATFSVTGTVDAAFRGTLSNTATVTAPAGTIDDPSDNTATDTTTVVGVADLQVTKDDGTATAVPGGTTTYTVTVTNAGPSRATGATLTDAVPAGATGFAWTCTASIGSTCPANGTGALAASLDLAPAGTATFAIVADIAAAATGTLVNTATVTPPGDTTDPTPANDSATDTDTLAPATDLSVTKDDGLTDAVPGQSVTYTIAVDNAGPSDAVGATVTDLVPAALTGVTWTCTVSGPGSCPAGGSGDIAASVDLPVGSTATFLLTGTIDPAATGTLANTATVAPGSGATDPDPSDDSATDTDDLTPTADLSVTKTDGVTTAVPGLPITYDVVVSNAGPSFVTGASVGDVFPAALTGATWTCTATAGSTCPGGGSGDIAVTVDLAPGGSATFTIDATVDPAATGTLSNQATVTAPLGVTDTNSGNDSATDVDTLVPTADLSVTKTDGLTSAQPGDPIVYTIVVSNAGPSAVADAPFDDPAPAQLTGVAWTCVAGAGANCDGASGSGDISTTVDLDPTAQVTFTVTATVAGAAAGTITNVATITAPAGSTDPDTGNNTATDLTTVTATADLSITKTDGLTTIQAGQPTTYTIVVSNAGPSAIVGAVVDDTFPAALTGVTWTCAASAGSTCPAGGSGDVAGATVDLLASGTATFTVAATVDPAAAAGTLTNTATVTQPSGSVDPAPGNNTATDTTEIERVADLIVTKDDGSGTAIPGDTTTYTVTVANAGPATVSGATVTDALPAGALDMTWTCSATAGSTCAASGTGSISELVDLAPGGVATFTVVVTIEPAATGTLANTAAVASPIDTLDPTPGNDSATDTDTLVPTADVAVTKTDGATNEVPGTPVSYTITVTNLGPSDVAGVSVDDVVPPSITSPTWTCSSGVGSTCGVAGGSGDVSLLVDLESGAAVTITLDGTIDGAASGTVSNTATAAVPSGVVDPDPSNDSATDTDTLLPVANLSITKTDGVATVVPGQSVTYTITAANTGPSDVVGATVTDTFPGGVSSVTWTCAGAVGGACGNPSGTGDVSELVDLPVGASVTFTVDAAVDPAAAGTLANTVTIGEPVGISDPDPSDNTATDTDTLAPQVDLAVTKDDGLLAARPGDPVSYAIVVSNAGPSAATGAAVADLVPAELTAVTWTCSDGAGGTCLTASGTGDVSASVDLGVGGQVTLAVDGTVAPGATGTMSNTVTVSAPSGTTELDPADNQATDTTRIDPLADLAISKTDGVLAIAAGRATSYTIVVANSGPSRIDGAVVSDTMPAGLVGPTWTCAADLGSACADASGTGNIATTLDLASGGTATFTVSATIDPAFSGTLTNTAGVALPAGALDPTPGNNTATDTTDVFGEADLSVTKSDGVASVVPGSSVSYSIVVSNAGPSAVSGASVDDVVPGVLSGAAWTCSGAAGGVCGAGSGSGDIAELVDLPVGGSVTFVLSGALGSGASGSLVNTATVAVPVGVTDPAPGNDTATDTDTITPEADLSVTKTDGLTAADPGDPLTYTIVVANAGPSDVVAARVVDAIPSALGSVSWTCTSGGGGAACGSSSGTGSIDELVDLPVGTNLTFTVDAVVVAGNGDITNTATVDVPAGVAEVAPGDNAATDATSINAFGNLTVTKTDGQTTAVPGSTTGYTIFVTNSGPSAAFGVRVVDAFPADLTAATWTCVAAAGSACGSATGAGDIDELIDVGPGSTVTFSVSATIVASASGTLSNTANITPPAGFTDSDLTDDTSTDVTSLTAVSNLTVIKTDGVTSVVPGASTTYTITVGNAGPSVANGARVTDPLPAALVGATWSCSATAGSSCPASGSGSIDELVVIASGGSATFTLDASVDPAATGPVANTATVTPPAGTTDPDPSDNSATDTDTLTPVADVSVTKTDGVASAVPGTTTTYSIVVTNAGPSAAPDTQVGDVLPAALTSASWTCIGAAGGSCDVASGTGDIATTVDLPPGGSATFTVSATIAPTATAPISNTATVATTPGVSDTNSSNDSATDVTTLVPTADLAITKTDGAATVVAGAPIAYTIVATNLGPSAVIAATVSDAMPPALTGVTWTCVAGAGGTCGAAGGSGAPNVAVDLAAGASVTVTVMATVAPGASGLLVNTATIASPAGVTDPVGANNTATDVDGIVRVTDLAVAKTDGLATALPGDPITYTIVVSNAGPSTATGARVTDTIPPELTGATWTCAASGTGASCGTASGAGNISALVDLPPGTTASFTVAATVDLTVTGTIANSVTVDAPVGAADPNSANNTATDSTMVSPLADVSITKTDGLASIAAGVATTYTIVVTNPGPSDLSGLRVVDNLPVVLTGATWTCAATAGSSCAAGGSGSIDELVDLLAGATATFTVDATVDPAGAGNIVNTATVTLPGGAVDPTATNNTATDLTVIDTVADLRITKTDGVTSVVPGTPVTYTIDVVNDGPSVVVGARVLDTLPAALTGATWTCVAAAGASCGVAGGSGDVDVLVDLVVGASVTVEVTATVTAAATGQVANVAAVAPGAGSIDPDLTNNTATDTDDLTPIADVAVTKTDGSPTAAPGAPTTYTISVTNAGPSTATNVVVDDPLPPSVIGASWTCTASAGSSCAAATGSGGVATTVTVAPGGTVDIDLTVTISPAATGSITNIVTVTVAPGVSDPDPSDNTASDTDLLVPTADISVTKTDGVAQVTAGAPTTYTIVVANAGPSIATGVAVDDVLPAGLTGATWTCSATPGSTCADGTGSGGLATSVDLASGGSATYTISATVAASATGTLLNTATAVPPGTIVDPDPSNNTAADSSLIVPDTDLSISKTPDRPVVDPGDSLSFTIVVANAGPSDATGVVVADVLPAGLMASGWTCAPALGAVCAASGTGDLALVADIPVGGTLTIVLATAVGSVAGTLVNTATATSLDGGLVTTVSGSASFAVTAPTTTTTTTTPGTTTTTTPGTTTTTTPGTSTPTTTTPGTTQTTVRGGQIVTTGADTAPMMWGAAIVLLLGLAALMASRTRRHRRI